MDVSIYEYAFQFLGQIFFRAFITCHYSKISDPRIILSQSAGAAEDTDCFSTEE